jgi:hypothetical protein
MSENESDGNLDKSIFIYRPKTGKKLKRPAKFGRKALIDQQRTHDVPTSQSLQNLYTSAETRIFSNSLKSSPKTSKDQHASQIPKRLVNISLTTEKQDIYTDNEAFGQSPTIDN